MSSTRIAGAASVLGTGPHLLAVMVPGSETAHLTRRDHV